MVQVRYPWMNLTDYCEPLLFSGARGAEPRQHSPYSRSPDADLRSLTVLQPEHFLHYSWSVRFGRSY
ncbi:hypothetical protein INR49_031926 [Caranx melampygus]|nr:hypothetical protein INR49_031926 [Caranx melampygus]